MSNPKISLINHIDTPPNPTSTNMLEIVYLGANIYLERQATPTTYPVMMENEMKERISYGSTIELTHIATLQLLGISKLAIPIHILTQMQKLGVLCDDGFTITLDKQAMSIQKNGEK